MTRTRPIQTEAERRRIISYEPSEANLAFLDEAKRKYGTPYKLTIEKAVDLHRTNGGRNKFKLTPA